LIILDLQFYFLLQKKLPQTHFLYWIFLYAFTFIQYMKENHNWILCLFCCLYLMQAFRPSCMLWEALKLSIKASTLYLLFAIIASGKLKWLGGVVVQFFGTYLLHTDTVIMGSRLGRGKILFQIIFTGNEAHSLLCSRLQAKNRLRCLARWDEHVKWLKIYILKLWELKIHDENFIS
jgi:hypothetical protein